MNKLWVRLQHHGSVSEKSKRELERNHLRLLVGSNLSRISQLEGVNNHIYAEVCFSLSYFFFVHLIIRIYIKLIN